MAAARDKSFDEAVAEIRAITTRAEIIVEEVPAPQKLAPFSLALTADFEDDAAVGRFVLLHDPVGQEGWGGKYRCVTFVRAAVEHEMATDSQAIEIGWQWLIESLEQFGCDYSAPSGTVTRTTSASFGTLVNREDDNEIEVRASWTPTTGNQLAQHVRAWLQLLELSAGAQPVPEGVSQLARPR
jgi:hypothetical protein